MGSNVERQWDIAACIYKLICEEDDKVEALQEFMECLAVEDDVEKEEIPEYFTPKEIQNLANNCGQMLKGTLRKLIAEKLTKQEFYARLWKDVIAENDVLLDEKEKIFALYYIWQDDRIPYFDVSCGLEMSDEEFSEIRKCKEELLRKATFVLNTNFLQKTQRSSVLLEIIDECEYKKEKAVILAHVLDSAEKKGAKKLWDRIQESE